MFLPNEMRSVANMFVASNNNGIHACVCVCVCDRHFDWASFPRGDFVALRCVCRLA